MEQNKNLNFLSQTGSKLKSKRPSTSKKLSNDKKYEGYNFNFDKEKEKVRLTLEQNFKNIAEEYEVVKLLGQGSYGMVAKAIHRSTKQPVAIKKYTHLYRDRIDSKRILREIAVMRRLDHPNVVKVYDIIVPDEVNVDSIYLVMELCDTDLKNLLYGQNSNLSENQVKKIMYDLLSGLDYIHKCGVLHRDLKPANICINLTNCTAKLCDFGLARDMTLEYETEMLMSLFYAFPQENKNLDYEGIKTVLSQPGEISQEAHQILFENIEVISEELFRKYSGSVPLGQNTITPKELILPPNNFLSEIEKDKANFGNSNYYLTYDKSANRDSKMRKNLTPHVITRWYRPPEIILLEPIYSSAVDVWSLGCIFGELLAKLKGNACFGPLFPGNSCHPLSPYIINKGSKTLVELTNDDQLLKIFSLLGSPNENDLDFLTNKDALEHIARLGFFPGKSLQEVFPACNSATLQLLSAMLTFNPTARISVQEVLKNDYFNHVRDMVKNIFAVDYSIIKAELVFLEFDREDFQPDFEDIRKLFLNEFLQMKKKKEEEKMKKNQELYDIDMDMDVEMK